MGRFPMEKPESRSLVDGWRRQPGMLGMRFTFNTEQQRPWLTDGTADWFWPEAERAGIPLMMSVSGQLPSVDRLAERHPGLKLVIDHLGLRSGTKGEQAFAGLPEFLKLARHERRGQGLRAALLLGRGLSLSRRAAAHPERVRRVWSAADVLGNRLDTASCTWRRAVTFFTEELPWLSAGDKEWIMGRGVCEWLGWPTPRAT